MRRSGLPRPSHLPALPAISLRVAPNLRSFSTHGAVAWSFPRSYALPVVPADAFPWVAPGFSIFRLCRRRSLELPRFSRPSAPLALSPRVAPRLRSSSCASWCGGGFPRACTFRLCLRFESPGCPELSPLRRRLMVPRVASVSAPSGFAVPASSGRPESCIYGWVNDDFPVLLELCILGWAADESSWSIGPCIFPTDSGCILNLIRP